MKTGFIKPTKTTKEAYPIVEPNFTHCEIIGQTGCGKTSSAILPNIARRIELGHACLIYDFKGSLAPKVKAIAKRCGILNKVVEIGLPWSKKINLIENLSINQIENLLTKAMGMDMSKDGFWIGSVLEITLPWIKFWRAFERLQNYINSDNCSQLNRKIAQTSLDSLHILHQKPTLVNLYNFLGTFKEIKNKAHAINDIYSQIVDDLQVFIPKIKEDKVLIAHISKTLEELKNLNNMMKKYSQINAGERSSTYTNILLSIHSALKNIGLQESFHTSQTDINRLLEEGRIVILHTKNLSDNALAFLSHSIFERFKSRFGSPNPVPISLFLDEVQRILNPQLVLPLDIMREAKVDFFIAHQTPSLLIEKIGKEQYEALSSNTSTKIIYKTGAPLDMVDTTELEKFEYHHSKDGYQSLYKTNFYPITFKEEFEAELKHQKHNKVTESFIFQKPKKPFILSYEPSRYENGFLTLRFEDGSQQEVEFFEKRYDRNSIYNHDPVLNALYIPTNEELIEMLENM